MAMVAAQRIQPGLGFRQRGAGAGFHLGRLLAGDARALQRGAGLGLGIAQRRQGGFGLGGARGGLFGGHAGLRHPRLRNGEGGAVRHRARPRRSPRWIASNSASAARILPERLR